jgi:hypothetical protein
MHAWPLHLSTPSWHLLQRVACRQALAVAYRSRGDLLQLLDSSGMDPLVISVTESQPLAACIPSLKCANDTQQRRQILYVLMTRKEDTKPFPCVVLAVPTAQSWTDGVDHKRHRKAAAAVAASSCSVLLQRQRKRTEQSHAGYFRVAGKLVTSARLTVRPCNEPKQPLSFLFSLNIYLYYLLRL